MVMAVDDYGDTNSNTQTIHSYPGDLAYRYAGGGGFEVVILPLWGGEKEVSLCPSRPHPCHRSLATPQ